MLQSIREHAQGWIAWVIVGLIILTFALFGIDQYAKGDKIVTVAEVNGEPVTARAFLTLYQQQQSRLKNQFGDMYDQVVDDTELREQVMQALIESVVVRQWAQNQNMIVSDQQLAATIRSAEVFQKDGAFDQQTYQDILMRNGLNVARFERQQRQHLIETQNRQLTMGSALVADPQVDALMTLQSQQRDVNYLRVDHRPMLETVTVKDTAIEDYYQDNIESFIEPEKVVLRYLKLDQADIAERIEVSIDQLQTYYDKNQDLFTRPQERQARHILIQIDESMTEAQALEKAQTIRKQIVEGASFADMAEKHSQDPGSAASGGDLGRFQQGMMVPAFDKVVFALEEGVVSEPVKTEFGYHLIEVTDIQAQTTPAFAEIESEVEKNYRQMQAEQRYYEQLDTLTTLTYEQPDTLMPAAEALDLSVVETDPVAKRGAQGPVLGAPKVMNQAFSPEVKQERMNSEVIELSDQSAVVVRVASVKPEQKKPLATVESSIRETLAKEQAFALSSEKAQTLLTQLQDQTTTMVASEAEGIEYHPVGWMGRNEDQLLPPLVQAIFEAPKPRDQAPTYTHYQLPTGDSVVIEVVATRQDPAAEKATGKQQLQQALNNLTASFELEARLAQMVAQAKIEQKDNYLTLKLR